MPEISLNVLDIAQNSIKALSTFIQIFVHIDYSKDTLTIKIEDNGIGMTKEEVKKALDPFFTKRKTRDVGLGIPFFKESCEITNGKFDIKSTKDIGTTLEARYNMSHINMLPLGDINDTIYTLIIFNTKIDFYYEYKVTKKNKQEKSFNLSTKEIKNILGDISLESIEVSNFIKEYLKENKMEVDK